MNRNFTTIAALVGAGVVAAGFVVWLVYFSGPATAPVTTDTVPLGTGDTRSTTAVSPESTTNNGLPVAVAEVSTQKVFKVAQGPIAGAALLQTRYPTTTVARFVLQNNGHVFDFVIDSPGAVPKAVSNTTIPGIARVVWSEGGRGVLLQYVDGDLKTAHLSLPAVGSTTPPVRIQFLPANIADVAVSPNGASVAYLIRTTAGADGYVAAANGASPKKLFSLPLSQVSLSWPSQGTLVAVSAPLPVWRVSLFPSTQARAPWRRCCLRRGLPPRPIAPLARLSTKPPRAACRPHISTTLVPDSRERSSSLRIRSAVRGA